MVSNLRRLFSYGRLITVILVSTCKKKVHLKRTEAPFDCNASIWHKPVGMSLLPAHQRTVKTNKTKPFPFAHPYSLQQLSLCELSIILAASSIPVDAKPAIIRLLCCRGQAIHWMGCIHWHPPGSLATCCPAWEVSPWFWVPTPVCVTQKSLDVCPLVCVTSGVTQRVLYLYQHASISGVCLYKKRAFPPPVPCQIRIVCRRGFRVS